MFIEQRTVSRKTPLDGKLEISAAAAAQLQVLGSFFALRTDGHNARARLVELTCTCSKGGSAGQHLHHFVESDALRSLDPGTEVRVEVDDAHPGSLSIAPA
jgi:hypothetical protein